MPSRTPLLPSLDVHVVAARALSTPLVCTVLLVFVSLPHPSYIVVRDDDAGEAPASLYELEFTVNVNGEAIDQSLAYLAER